MDTCPICKWNFSDGDFESIPYPGKGQQHSQVQIPTSIRFCGECGTGIAHPTISDKTADKLYAQGEYWKQSTKKLPIKTFPVPFGLAQARWRLIEESLRQSEPEHEIRLLDIGAGHGYLGLVASLNPNVSLVEYHAIEPDPAMQQYLQNMWTKKGCNQSLTVTASMDQITGLYDVVVLSHVLEHLQDPSSLINSATALLSSKGLLFVDVPNQDHLFRNNVFPHIVFFSPSSLRFVLEKEQLGIIHLETWGRNMYKSPSHIKAPLKMKIIGGMIRLTHKFLPSKFLIHFYAWYFGGNKMNAEGTWIRALCKRKQ
ncbi:MAG: methyltransferase domain-containing protein [Planctomycetes bacterium]|nr:methyltransferase domain-containing protein [Planctomycetota bacterium]